MEHTFDVVGGMTPEDCFVGLRQAAACVQLSREQVTELISITAMLSEERKRVKRLLSELPESFAEVRTRLNELARTLR